MLRDHPVLIRVKDVVGVSQWPFSFGAKIHGPEMPLLTDQQSHFCALGFLKVCDLNSFIKVLITTYMGIFFSTK